MAGFCKQPHPKVFHYFVTACGMSGFHEAEIMQYFSALFLIQTASGIICTHSHPIYYITILTHMGKQKVKKELLPQVGQKEK